MSIWCWRRRLLTVKIIGLVEMRADFAEIIKNIGDVEIITKELADLMSQYVHVDTGYLRSSIYYAGNSAGASAEYAGFEDDRGGSHAYGTRAAEDIDIEKWADYVVRPF
jgi:hypothetical protein